MITIHEKAEKLLEEKNFEIFKHEYLLCCIQRIGSFGNLNGYVAVTKEHRFYNKKYSDRIKFEKEPEFNGNFIGMMAETIDDNYKENIYSIDMALKVHGGITYSESFLFGIENNLFGELWWFGFDTVHAWDIKPYQNEIDRKYSSNHDDSKYRDFEYVKNETISLAKQLSNFK